MWPCSGRPPTAALAAAALALMLAGCATAPPVVPPPPPAADQPREWSGRFSVRVESDGADSRQEAATGRFSLLARPTPAGRALEVDLTSPFGQTVAHGRRAPDGASSLELADGRRFQAGTLDGVLERALGWPLPIERLPDWLDDRFQAVLERDAAGQAVLANDSGWRIEREPRRWTLSRPHAQGRLLVVLLLDR
jgi:outer membrane biogenesis lipoprotein LolB